MTAEVDTLVQSHGQFIGRWKCLLPLPGPVLLMRRNATILANHATSHSLSTGRVRLTESRGPKGLQLELGPGDTPRLLEVRYIEQTCEEVMEIQLTCCMLKNLLPLLPV